MMQAENKINGGQMEELVLQVIVKIQYRWPESS